RGTEEQQKTAYDVANTYIESCPDDPNDAQLKAVKKFVAAYKAWLEQRKASGDFQKAVDSRNYAEQMRLGKQILATDPDQVDVNVLLGIAGLGDAKLLNESAQYAKKAIDLLGSGKSTKVYSKDQALAYLNWTLAKSKLTSAPADAISELLKVAKIESDVKKKPELYLDLAAAYESGPRAKLSEEYTSSLKPDKTETDQSKLILLNLNPVIDNQIDAEARAAALTTDAVRKKEIVTELTSLYKYRNKTATDANVTELMADVLSRPIPDVPTPITSLPTPAPASTAAPIGGTNGAPTNSSTNAGKPAGNNMNTNTSNPGPARGGTAQPVPSPSPKKPR
ncbi:MAG TPA: hypothetical protein VKD91_09705, partial [Pyrinomonadaceae bacterium]|nr:hypothetical protein [Pyrinomonadaceae bacterium]